MEIRPLQDSDDRAAFRSGDPDLDRFFTRYAGQNQFRHHIGVTYVALAPPRIVGFVTVAASTLEAEALSPAIRRRLPAYPLPALRLARLAVDVSAQSRGIGSALLRHAFQLAVEMANRVGCIGVVVDAKPDAVAFYTRFGFSELGVATGHMDSRPAPTPMFLPLELILAAVAPGDRQ